MFAEHSECTMPFDSNKPCPCGLHGKSYGECCEHKGPNALGNAMQRGNVSVMLPGTRTPTQSSMVNGDTRWRIVWNVLWHSPQEKTFHDFLDELVLKTLGWEWFEEQNHLPIDKRHAIAGWRSSLLSLAGRPANTPDGGHIRTGPVESYLCLSYDLYWLQIVHKLPDRLIERLKDRRDFQGARYEILVAAVFARAGFDIQWLDGVVKKGKHCEFIAVHKSTRAQIAVETKSRQRTGALHFKGVVSPETHLKGDIFGLYETAVKQGPTDGTPYLIFIDANVPASFPPGALGYSNVPIDEFPWMAEIRDGLASTWNGLSGNTAETGVFVTNFAYYYGSDEGTTPIGMCGHFLSPKPNVALRNTQMIDDLVYCLRFYAQIPRQV
jgi:hypothetical protein